MSAHVIDHTHTAIVQWPHPVAVATPGGTTIAVRGVAITRTSSDPTDTLHVQVDGYPTDSEAPKRVLRATFEYDPEDPEPAIPYGLYAVARTFEPASPRPGTDTTDARRWPRHPHHPAMPTECELLAYEHVTRLAFDPGAPVLADEDTGAEFHPLRAKITRGGLDGPAHLSVELAGPRLDTPNAEATAWASVFYRISPGADLTGVPWSVLVAAFNNQPALIPASLRTALIDAEHARLARWEATR